MNALILAAGLGTRLRPWTLSHPKALIEVAGKPMLQHVIENIRKTGINDIVINIHHFGDQIVDFVKQNDNFGCKILFSDESKQLLDTGGAIVKAFSLTDSEPMLIHNADIMTDIDLNSIIETHLKNKSDATLLTSSRNSSRQLLVGDDTRLRGWINNTTGETIPSTFGGTESLIRTSFNGIHIINQTVVNWLENHVQEEAFPIIPQYIAMSQELGITCYTHPNKYKWIDIGKPETLQQANTM